MDIISKMMGRDVHPSKNVAKERLRLVLVHDRASVSPKLLESLKEDMLGVISEYMDIDRQGTEVNINSDDHSVALVASIPINKIKRC